MRILCCLFLVIFSSCSIRERAGDEPALALSSEQSSAQRAAVERDEPTELKNAYFAYDLSVLDAQAKAALKHNARWLKKNPGTRVQIEGYCDEKGSFEYNLELGAKRAGNVKRFLRELGVSEQRMSTLSVGRIPGTGDVVRARNRRAGFIVVYE
jgi:peptidoglycan-associated lipoprotein